jgi:hypothetical protein
MADGFAARPAQSTRGIYPKNRRQAAAMLGAEIGLKIAHNTYLHRIGRDIVVRLWNTNIVTYCRNGDIILNLGGWNTMLTRGRINRYIDDWRVYSEHNVPKLYGPGRKIYRWPGLYDEVTIFADGRTDAMPVPPRRSRAQIAADETMRAGSPQRDYVSYSRRIDRPTTRVDRPATGWDPPAAPPVLEPISGLSPSFVEDSTITPEDELLAAAHEDQMDNGHVALVVGAERFSSYNKKFNDLLMGRSE